MCSRSGPPDLVIDASDGIRQIRAVPAAGEALLYLEAAPSQAEARLAMLGMPMTSGFSGWKNCFLPTIALLRRAASLRQPESLLRPATTYILDSGYPFRVFDQGATARPLRVAQSS